MDDANDKLPPPPENIVLHGLLMLVLVLLVNLAQTVLAVCAIIQFFWMLIGGKRNARLVTFGRGIANWLAVTARFLTAGSDEPPFPWREWDAR